MTHKSTKTRKKVKKRLDKKAENSIIRASYYITAPPMYNPSDYTAQARKRSRTQRKVYAFLVALFVLLAVGYVGHSDYETKQLEALSLTK